LSSAYLYSDDFFTQIPSLLRRDVPRLVIGIIQMIEPEIAFAGLQEDMDLAEDYLKYCVHYALTNCAEDLELLEGIPGWDSELRKRCVLRK
jgi:hypothetical protein